MQPKLKPLSRRQFLWLGGGTATAFLAGCNVVTASPAWPTPTGQPLPVATTARPTAQPSLVELELTAAPAQMQLFSGKTTTVWRYTGQVLAGDASALQPIDNSYLGPTIRVRRGQRVRIHFKNDLPEESVVHWHGLIVPEEADGHPRDVVGTGGRYTIEFDVINRAGMYWYHPHPDMRTGPQAYYGLAGLFIVTDEEEQSADLPSGAYDVPLVIQDRTFDGDNQLVYARGGMMDNMMGFLGDQLMINGRADNTLAVATRPYRLRLLNGSNSRIYKLAWSDGTPVTVIGTDGGLLAQPVERPYVMLAPGERVELWVEFGRYSLGSQPTLQSQPFFNSPSTYDVVQFKVEQKSAETQPLPTQLSTIAPLQPQQATIERDVVLAMARMRWTLNGRVYELDGVAADERVKANEIASWTFINRGGGGRGMMGGMMTLPHPMHVHATQFQVVDRQIDAAMRAEWEQVREGFIDTGWKDTVLVMPGERVTVLMPFTDYTGTFVYHCHNLEHEDMGMMRNFEVVA